MRTILPISRPRFWLYLAGPVLLANGLTTHFFSWILFLYFLLPANLILYGINDFFDQDTDAYNPKKHTFETRFSTLSSQRSLIISITVCFVLSTFLFINLSSMAQTLFMVWMFLSVAYSARPFRFKAIPIIDSFSNILYIIPGLIAYVTLNNTLPPLEVIIAGALWTIAMHLYSAIPDQKPDREAGVQTTATLLGTRVSLILCAILWALSMLTALMFSKWGIVLGVYPTLIVWLLATNSNQKNLEKVYWKFPYINTLIGMFLYILICLTQYGL